MTDYEEKARIYAEKIGVYEFTVKGKFMQYWSFFGNEGFIFVRYDLEQEREVYRGDNIPWTGKIPEFLLDPETGATLYNYMEG